MSHEIQGLSVRLRHVINLLLVSGVTVALASNAARGEEVLRAGLIGCDTSHAIAFTKILNAADAVGPLADVQVVAAFPGGSEDIPSSRDRVGEYTEQLRGMGVEMVESIEALLAGVDVVLLESVDGRPHLEQARPVLAAKKPVFIDKPFAGSLADAVEIFELAKSHGTPCFSSSGLRYSPAVDAARDKAKVGEVLGCDAYSPCSLEVHHPDLFWYGVHGVETLFTIMGTGCQRVTRIPTDGTDVVVGVWKDGRIGTFRGTRTGKHTYGATTFGSNGNSYGSGFAGYDPLVIEVAKFLKTGVSPVPAAETLEIFAFMEAADESKRQAGATVSLESVLTKAREEVAARR